MALMRSFSYGFQFGATELSGDILNLFMGLVENPEKRVEFSDEIISAGLQGRINFKKRFNIDAYEAAIRTTDRLRKYQKAKKEKHISLLLGEEPEYEDNLITEEQLSRRVIQKMVDAYEELANDEELQFAIESVKSMQSIFFVEEKIDILHTIRQALDGIPASVEILRRICRDYEVFSEQIWVILGSGKSYEELFAC